MDDKRHYRRDRHHIHRRYNNRNRNFNNANRLVNNMGYQRAPYDTTEYVKQGSPVSDITGKNDMIFFRNKYQRELDNAHASIVNMVHYIEDEEKHKLKPTMRDANKNKQDIVAHEEERRDLYTDLNNLLNKEVGHEYKMWLSKTSYANVKGKTTNIKQRLKDSEVEEMNFGAMNDFFKQYPQYATKSSFSRLLEEIKLKDNEIRKEKEKYNYFVSEYNNLITNFEKYIKKAEDKIAVYNNIYKEGKEILDQCRYRKSTFYKLSSERTKQSLALDTLKHRVTQFKNTLSIIQRDFSKYKNDAFEKMEY